MAIADVFAKASLKITAANEMSLTANQDIKTMDANKSVWPTKPANEHVAAQLAEHAPFERRVPFEPAGGPGPRAGAAADRGSRSALGELKEGGFCAAQKKGGQRTALVFES